MLHGMVEASACPTTPTFYKSAVGEPGTQGALVSVVENHYPWGWMV